MKVLVFSDSHGDTTKMLEIVGRELPDAVIHLGDHTEDAYDIRSVFETIPVYIVRGNNDWDSREPATLKQVLAGVPIFMSHGHIQLARQGTQGMFIQARDAGCTLALFGHTHQALIESKDGMQIMNPGSIRLPRKGKPSYIRLMLCNGAAQGEIIYID